MTHSTKVSLWVFTFMLFSSIASAHIPELVLADRNYTLEPVLVKDPEVSYAYYGRMQGSPQQYKIVSEKPFLLYVSLLVPYVGQEEKSEVEFHIWNNGKKIVMMHNYTNWSRWYEPVGGDWYLQGPSHESRVDSGEYIVEVHSKTN